MEASREHGIMRGKALSTIKRVARIHLCAPAQHPLSSSLNGLVCWHSHLLPPIHRCPSRRTSARLNKVQGDDRAASAGSDVLAQRKGAAAACRQEREERR